MTGNTIEEVEKALKLKKEALSMIEAEREKKEDYELEAFDQSVKVLQSNSQASFWIKHQQKKTNWKWYIDGMIELYESIGNKELDRLFGGKL